MPHREQSLVYEVQKSDLTRDSSEWLRKHSEMSVVVWGEVESKVEIHARADIGSAISGKGGRGFALAGAGVSPGGDRHGSAGRRLYRLASNVSWEDG